jgi:transketolase C-terminal domain/subunit
VYGESLLALGRENPNIVACDADFSKSTMSCLFAEAFPERFFEVGIAEANDTFCAYLCRVCLRKALRPDSDKRMPGQLYVTREGTDAVVFVHGVMVSKALEAARHSGLGVPHINKNLTVYIIFVLL